MNNSLFKYVTESLETAVPGITPEKAEGLQTASAAEQSIKNNADGAATDEIAGLDNKVVMNGPLSMIFTRALNIAYAKKSPVSGEYEGVTPQAQTQQEAVAVESQAQDYYLASQAAAFNNVRNFEARENDPSEPKPKELPDDLSGAGTSGAKLQADITKEEIINFINSDDFANKFEPGSYMSFVPVRKIGAPTDGVYTSPHENESGIFLGEDANQGTVVVESIEIVVHTRTIPKKA